MDDFARLKSEAEYREIFPGVTMRCRLNSTNCKDEMVFSSREAVRKIVYHVTAEGLTLKKDGDGLTFADRNGEAIYILQQPFCYDKRHEEEKALSYNVEPGDASGSWRIVYTLPEKWLEEADFPVTLDPSVVTFNKLCAIEDAFTSSAEPNENHKGINYNLLALTKGNQSMGDCDCYFRFGDQVLPELDPSEYIVNAVFRVATPESNINPTESFDAVAHEVTGDWTPISLTYNNRPSNSAKVLDYSRIEAPEADGAYHIFTITNLVRKWYTGANHGLMLTPKTTTRCNIWSSRAWTEVYRPVVVIDYQSKTGLEEQLAYESHSIGRGGTGMVSLYNGNLIFTHQDTETKGNLMPVSTYHVYNSCFQDVNVWGAGFGWKLNLQQFLWRESISGRFYYVWLDETGTKVYFTGSSWESGDWKDGSGRDLRLRIEGSEAFIIDKQDRKRVFLRPYNNFDDNWANAMPMTRMENALGETMYAEWDQSGAIRFKDGVNRVTATVRTNDLLTGITPPGDSIGVGFAYSSAQLSAITDQDSAQTIITYLAGTQLISEVLNHDGVKVQYTYTADEPRRVLSVKVFSSEGGNDLISFHHSYAYGNNMTVVTDQLSGKSIRCHFDDSGKLISMSDELGFALAREYGEMGPEQVSGLQRTVLNLLRDPMLANDSLWIRASGSGGTGTYAHDTLCTREAVSSLRITKTNAVGDVNVRQMAALTKGKTYTLSVWCQTQGAARAIIAFHYQNAGGAYVLDLSEAVESAGDWTRLSHTFTLPTDAASVSVNAFLFASGGVGSVWFEGAQLEESVTASHLNLISNSDFRSGLLDWSADGTLPGGTVVSVSALEHSDTYPEGLSGKAFQMTGDGTGAYRRLMQDIPVKGSEGDVFVAGGWSLAESVSRQDINARYNMEISFYNGSVQVMGREVLWGTTWGSWKIATAPVIAPCDYQSVRVKLYYDHNYNAVQYGGLFLFKEEFGQSFVYDDEGNIVSAKNAAALKEYAEYDEYNNMISYRGHGRAETEKTTLNWGTGENQLREHLLRYSVSPMGVRNELLYLPHGSLGIQRWGDENGLHIQESIAYTDNYNHPLTLTDTRGNTRTQIIDENLGTLLSETDPLNHTIQNSYDVLKRLTHSELEIGSKKSFITCSYASDALAQLIHNTSANTSGNVTFTFQYDTLARLTAVKVGTITLFTRSYAADGTISQILYGNNGKITYTYDSFKRLTGVKFDSDAADRFTYVYGSLGETAQILDSVLNRIIRNEFDFAGRPVRKSVLASSGSLLYRAEIGYDAYGNPGTFKETVPGNSPFLTTITYNADNQPTLISYSSGLRAQYFYDTLGRLHHRSIGPESGLQSGTEYEFLAGANGSSSLLISRLTAADVILEYSYDALDRITAITETKNGTTKTITYVYDGFGQLTRVNDPFDPTGGSNGTTWKFTYDLGGNITSKKAYAYSTGATGTELQSNTYFYGNSQWKDVLTKRNGVTITRDVIGNPLSDGTWFYTWQNGRELAQMSKTGESVQFLYNEDGIRVRKTAASTGTTDYTVQGRHVVHLINGSNEMHFFYGAESRPAVVRFNGSDYRYMYNAQGDVIGLLDGSNNWVVEYRYDAWGKPVRKAGDSDAAPGISGSLRDSLGVLQPFRYRGYVYDQETGLYYVSNRYYDPEICRWINADDASNLCANSSLFSCNLFAYCLNDPVNYLDQGGENPYGILDLQDYREMHHKVQESCATKYGWEMEIYVKGKKGRGFLDLLDVRTNEYYEVKSSNVYGLMKKYKRFGQMEKYDVAIIPETRKNRKIQGLKIGSGVTRGEIKAHGNLKYGIYDVEYNWAEKGIIIYRWEVNRQRAIETAVVELAILLAITYPAAIPATAAAATAIA